MLVYLPKRLGGAFREGPATTVAAAPPGVGRFSGGPSRRARAASETERRSYLARELAIVPSSDGRTGPTVRQAVDFLLDDGSGVGAGPGAGGASPRRGTSRLR